MFCGCSVPHMLQHEATLRKWFYGLSTGRPHPGYKNLNKGRLYLRIHILGDLHLTAALQVALIFTATL